MCEEKIEMPTHWRFQNLTGERFERLVVVEYAGKRGKHQHWKCLCDCGNSTTVQGGNLKNGHIKSCGCLQRELSADRATTHGKSTSKRHKGWEGIKDRCTNPNSKRYDRYKGMLAEEFMDFEVFDAYIEEELGPQPEGTTFDRIDNEKGYERGNIRYATRTQQARNQRTNLIVEAFGETMCLAEAVERFSELKYICVYCRLFAAKRNPPWTVEEALTTPVRIARAATITR